jgi:translocation and assembly module TamA
LTFDGDPPSAAALAAAQAAIHRIQTGAPARAASVLEAEAAAVKALQDAGYADAAAGARRVVVDHASQLVAAHFVINAGGFARLGHVRAEPAHIFRPSFINGLRNWKPGDAYTPDHVARLRRDLSQTGAVATVTTHLEPPGADGLRDVVLSVEPAKRNAYELGFGYSTTEGAGVDAQWTRRNLTGRADSLTLASTLGEKTQSLSVLLTRPDAAGLGLAQNFSLSTLHEITSAFDHTGVALNASVDAAPRMQQALSYGVRLSQDHYDQSAGIASATVLSAFGDFRRDTTNTTLDPFEGHIFEFRLEPTVSTGDATIGFVRGTAEGRFYRSFGGAAEPFTLAARVRTGWLVALSGSPNDVPPDHRFYAGGGGSVRGYAYDSIYPHERDALGLTPGGQGVLETSVEARWRFSNGFGAAAFIDGGNAFDNWNDAANLRWGVGVGLRYNLGFAPLRADIAIPLNREAGDKSFALYISLGQAF